MAKKPPAPPPPPAPAKAKALVHAEFDALVLAYVRAHPGSANGQICIANPDIFKGITTLTPMEAVALSLQRLKARNTVVLLKRLWYPASQVPCPTCKGSGHVVQAPTPPPVLGKDTPSS